MHMVSSVVCSHMGWTLSLGEGAAPGPSCHTDTASAISAGVTGGVASKGMEWSVSGVGVEGRGIKISPLVNAYNEEANEETVSLSNSCVSHMGIP